MTTIQPMHQINSRVTQLLIRHMGVADTLRFYSQFQIGSGDYTAERKRLFEGMTVRQLAGQIREENAQKVE